MTNACSRSKRSRGLFSKPNDLETACNNIPVSRNGAQPAPRLLFHFIFTACVAYLVALMLNRPNMRAARLACSTSAAFSSALFLVAFWQNPREEQRSARSCSRSRKWSAESKVYCRAGAALHCRSRPVCGESFQIFVWRKSWFVDKQVDIVKEPLSKCSCL